MELSLQNVGIINKATIKLNGLTVICGSNNSGKSTAGKALYATIESLSNLEDKWYNDLSTNYRRTLISIRRLLDLESVVRYIDIEKMQEYCQKDFSILLQMPYRRSMERNNVVNDFISLKETVEFLTTNTLLEFSKKTKSELPKRFFAFLENFEENREKALSLLSSLNKYYFDENRQAFAEKSVAALFDAEFNGQVYPVNLKSKEKKSYISISKNGEIGSSITLIEKKEITAVLSGSKLFLNNVIYIEDPYALDKLSSDDEFSIMYRIHNKLDYSHTSKLNQLLLKRNTKSLIEKSINEERYNNIITKINKVIPGILTMRDSGLYYEETNKEPLRVQNLATGSKMFSIIKNLLGKGEINFDTMLILDEPESHLHPEWQNIFAEIIILLVKELDVKILLTTHSPNFLMALEAYSKKYKLDENSNYYMAKNIENGYLVDYHCVNRQLSDIYSTFALPLIKSKQLKDS